MSPSFFLNWVIRGTPTRISCPGSLLFSSNSLLHTLVGFFLYVLSLLFYVLPTEVHSLERRRRLLRLDLVALLFIFLFPPFSLSGGEHDQ